MVRRVEISEDHPLRKLFRGALDIGFRENPPNQTGVGEYIEEQILCEFIHADNFYKIEEAGGKSLEDIADMLAEGDIRLNAQSFSREFEVHKHIGDYTLFMLGMFPSALSSKKGKEFVLGGIVVPGSSLSEHYVLQGQRSYRLASEFSDSELFLDLSSNFILYRNVLELVRIFLESARSREYLKAQQIIGTDD